MDREDHTFISPPGSEATTVPAGVSTRIHTKIGNFRWAICALLFFGVMINYMDRQILGIFKMTLQKDLGWNEVDYGHLIAVFQAAYAAGLLLVGRWVDRLGTRRGYSLAMIFWSLASMAHAAGRTLGQFVMARAALGVGEAGVFPTSIKCVAEWFPKKERALATGIFNAGTNAGAILTPIVAPLITVLLGWRWAFFTVGALGFVWLFFWLVLYARPEEHRRCGRAELDYIRSDPNESVQKIPWVRLLSLRQTWAFIIAKFLTDPIWWFYLFWVPDFLQRRHNLRLLQASLPLATIYLIAAFGSVAGGWISSSLIARGSTINVSRKIAMLVCALCVPPIVFAPRVEGLWSAVFIIGLAAAAHQGFSANLFTLSSDMFPSRAVASVVGIGGMAGAIGGMLIANLVGHLLQWTGSYMVPFLIAGSVYLLALGFVHLLAPKLEPARINEAM